MYIHESAIAIVSLFMDRRCVFFPRMLLKTGRGYFLFLVMRPLRQHDAPPSSRDAGKPSIAFRAEHHEFT